jgi:hypothetical protein
MESPRGTDASLGNAVSQCHVEVQLTTDANAYCECLIGSIRRECLDYLIPLNERHLKRIFREFITH